MEKYTAEQEQEKKDELTKKYGEIHSICVTVKLGKEATESMEATPADVAYLWLKRPGRKLLMAAIDKSLIGEATIGAEMILESSAIREESDSRFFDNASANDQVYFAAIGAITNYFQVYQAEFKKK